MVISAPTGSGKTVLFELCILRLLSRFISTEGKFIHVKGSLKTVYVAPSKALVQEKLRDWNQKLGSWGINCLELTGDNEYYNNKDIQDADIILTTPEKFDAVTRYRIKDGGLSFFSDIALVLIDEVHLLNDPRGAALEAVVSRIKMLSCISEMKLSPLAHVRFLAVSATIPNINDLAEWLMVPNQGIKKFGEEMRPVKLTTKVFDILMQHSRGKSALVFCSTRKGAQETAQRLTQAAMKFGHSNPFIKSREQQDRLREASLSCSDKQMQSYIPYGVGYHNGGLSMKDRNLIEGLFLNSDLQVLCTTNTLAQGINLPAHTVIIKSTQHLYVQNLFFQLVTAFMPGLSPNPQFLFLAATRRRGLYMEYDRSMILQMCGRAGRPQFDDAGVVVIMTRKELLLPCITEHLTAQIVQTDSVRYYKGNRMDEMLIFNPENYAMTKLLASNNIERHLQEICVKKVNELSRYQMIWTDEDGFLLKPLEPAKLMTKYYLKFDTMKHIMQASANCSIEDALHIICHAEEIAWIQLRRNEKKLLNDINNDKNNRLRFHILGDKNKRKKRIQTREEKIFILANDCLTGDPLVHELSMTQDMNSICTNGCRIAKCMKEYFVYKKNYIGALSSALLAKCLHQKVWDDSPYLLKQLPGIGMVTAKALNSMGVKSFEALADADPRKIEMVTGRKYPFGNHIKGSLLSLPPKIEMEVKETESQRQGKSKVVITLTRMSQPALMTKGYYADLVVGLGEGNLILFHEKISPYSATVIVPNPQKRKLTVKADLIFDEFIGVDIHQKVTVMKEMNQDISNKHKTRQNPSFQLKEAYIVEDNKDSTSEAPIEEPLNVDESEVFRLFKFPKPQTYSFDLSVTKFQFSVARPSFTLIDEEPDKEVVTAVGTEDDECKVITERTIFDHIREKAKSLPPLGMLGDPCFTSLETLAQIRKRTRERLLAVENPIEVLDEGINKVARHSMTIQSARGHQLEKSFSDKDATSESHYISKDNNPTNDTGKHPSEPNSVQLVDLTKKPEFGQMQGSPILGRLKTTGSKLYTLGNQNWFSPQSSHTNSDFEGFKARKSEVIVLDPEPVERKQHEAIGVTKLRDNVCSGSAFSRSDITSQSSVVSSSPPCTSLPRNEVGDLRNSSETKCKQHMSTPSLLERQRSSPAVVQDTREMNCFLGFKSVFTFL
nr:DExH-box ATP-dependent RNA helicase DExH17 isoform X1 [Ipomoea batatas]